jgi:hypothetical protein
MTPKNRMILAIIAITAALVILLQTLYRYFYETFPWSVNDFHTVKYKASLGFIHPDSMTVLIILTGLACVLFVSRFLPSKKEYPGL